MQVQYMIVYLELDYGTKVIALDTRRAARVGKTGKRTGRFAIYRLAQKFTGREKVTVNYPSRQK